MRNRGLRGQLVRTSLIAVGLTFAGSALLTGCNKARKAPPAPERVSNALAVVAPTTLVQADAPAPNVDPSSPAQASFTGSPRCSEDTDWSALELKHLHDGRVETAKAGLAKPTFKWVPCNGDKQCERLELAAGQKLLAIGTNGKTLKLAVTETCNKNTTVTLGTPDEPASVVLRGVDMTFESAVIGGERLLLSGFARHPSERAKDGFVPRDYLLSVRETTTLSVEPARNKQKAVPVAAANQLVRVHIGDQACTTLFWKLGVEQCDFLGARGANVALVGSSLIYVGDTQGASGTKGMAWSAAAGHRELLPKLDWVISDGVNVAWSTGSELLTTQPRWDLPELKGKVAPGEPGPRPIAFGCGRTLTPSADGWTLRILATGTQWALKSDRFPEPASSVAMNCDWIVSSTGYRTSLAKLGKPTLLSTATPTEVPSVSDSRAVPNQLASAGVPVASAPAAVGPTAVASAAVLPTPAAPAAASGGGITHR